MVGESKRERGLGGDRLDVGEGIRFKYFVWSFFNEIK